MARPKYRNTTKAAASLVAHRLFTSSPPGTVGTGADSPTDSPVTPCAPAPGGRGVRDSWIHWLSPVFVGRSAYFTGTYSDEYGLTHGCTLQRNVHKDFRRFIDSVAGDLNVQWICAVERHQYRDVLHLHAIIRGDFDSDQLDLLKALWECERGHARVLPVLDGCASYVTKYALKNDTDSFDWNLHPSSLLAEGLSTEHGTHADLRGRVSGLQAREVATGAQGSFWGCNPGESL